MAWLILDGFDDRLNMDDDGDSSPWEDNWYMDGWGLYPEGLWEGEDYILKMNGIELTGRYDNKGAFCIQHHPDVYGYNYNYIRLYDSTTTGIKQFSFGCALRSSTSGDIMQCRRYDGSYDDCFRLGITQHGGLELTRATATSSERFYHVGGNLFTNYGWHYVHGRVGVGLGTNSDYVEVWVDGNKIIDLTGITLDPQGIGAFRIEFPDTMCEMDDMYFETGTSQIHGEPRIIALTPNAAGLDSDFTPGTYDQVDELDQDFDTSQNVSNGTSGHRDSFHLSAATDQVSSGTVIAVVARIFAYATGGESIRPYVVVGSTRYYGSSQAVRSDTYAYVQHIWENNPATSNPWTLTELDSVQVGYEVV